MKANPWKWIGPLLILIVFVLPACTTGPVPVPAATNTPLGSSPTLEPSPTVIPPTETPAAPPATQTPTLEPTATSSPTPEPPPVLLAVGDIASCTSSGDEATAELVARLEGPIAVLGDIAYDRGTAADFANCWEPSWGQFKDRIYPSPGNHEYYTQNADPYFDYFGPAAGERGQGWYSFNLGEWHIVSLNSNCSFVGGCGVDSPQGQWLQADLAANPAQCTLAFFHTPLYSSGSHGNVPVVQPLWEILYQNGADMVLNGHDHTYERFVPMDPYGSPDPLGGIRQFVVGTGGNGRYNFTNLQAGSELRENGAYGVLELTLHPGSYDWEFIPANAAVFTDAGSGECH